MTTIVVPYHLDVMQSTFDSALPADETVIVDLPEGTPWERLAVLYEAVARRVHEARDPIVVSNDCTTALGTVAGLQRRHPEDLAIVWFDGHGDVQTPETTASGYLGGMPLRLLVGYHPELIGAGLGLRPVPEERVVLVGARDLDPPEAQYLEDSRISRVEVADVSSVDLPDGPLYLHVDFDVVTPEELPGLLFPAPDGPSLAAVSRAIRAVVDTGRVVGVGLACTWRPSEAATAAIRPHLEAALS
jgi:arginase